MASPQTDNGFTPIANEILDALYQIRIPGEARQILDYIIRKTYGWNKKEDPISLSQFSLATRLSKVHVCRALDTLIKMNLVTKKGNALSLFTKKGNDVAISYSFQKDFDEWMPLPKKVTFAKDVTQKGNFTLPKKDTTKDNVKDSIVKEPADAVFSSKHYSVKMCKEDLTKTDEACRRLIEKGCLKRKFNPHQAVQMYINKGIHPRAVLECLEAMLKNWSDVRSPMGWMRRVVDKMNFRVNETLRIEESKEMSKACQDFFKALPSGFLQLGSMPQGGNGDEEGKKKLQEQKKLLGF